MSKLNIKITESSQEEKYRVYTLEVSSGGKFKEYKIFIFDSDLPYKESELNQEKLEKFVLSQMNDWIDNSGGNLPKDPYRVLINGGKVITDNIESFLSVEKKLADLVRTNVTISAPLYEWAKSRAGKDNTSFSDLVSRGLLLIKESGKETLTWYKAQGSYFRGKLAKKGSYGSFEILHYLPNSTYDISNENLREALKKAERNRTGWPIGVYLEGGNQRPTSEVDGIKAEYEDTPSLISDYWYARNNGDFYFSRVLESDSGHGNAKPGTVVYFDTLVWRIAEGIEHCIEYYKALGANPEERINLRMGLNGINGRSLSAWNHSRAFTLHHRSAASDIAIWETEVSLSELEKNIDEKIYAASRKLLIMFDFFVPNQEVLSSILNDEYRKSRM